MIKLYQKSSKGKIKFLELSTKGADFITTWGLLGGKTQTTVKTCIAMNTGKSNETSPEQQAIIEMNAKAVLKKKEGYSEIMPSEEVEETSIELDLDNLPVNFCPNKPISKMPDKVLNSSSAYGQRKHNGHCLIFVRGTGSTKVYTRRMENITEYVSKLPIIKEAMDKVPEGSFILHECVYFSNIYKKEMPRYVAQVITKEDANEALTRYNELSNSGTYSLITLDALFLNHIFVGNKDHLSRVSLLSSIDLFVPEIFYDWRSDSRMKEAKDNNWEGFIVRLPDETSHIGYTLDGKAKRAGGWKYKFLAEDDFVVDCVQKGISGKHSNFYAKFHVIQYDSTGSVIDRGFVGPGTLSHEQLEELTNDITSGKRKLPFVVEIEFQSIHDESGKLEFGQIQRIREDKTPEECICE